jgi:hypothetical protein
VRIEQNGPVDEARIIPGGGFPSGRYARPAAVEELSDLGNPEPMGHAGRQNREALCRHTHI